MAECERSTPAPGVTKLAYSGHFYLVGKIDDLLKSGLVEKTWLQDGKTPFPGLRNGKQRIARTKSLVIDGRKIRSTIDPQGITAQVLIESASECEKAKPRLAKKLGPYAHRIDELATRAIQDYNGDKGCRVRNIAPGVTRYAHSWCVDLRGSAEALIDAGLAIPAWFADEEWCKEVMMGNRRIEVYRGAGNYQIELSIRYTSKDRAEAKAQEPEDEDD